MADSDILQQLIARIAQRRSTNPPESYTAKLLRAGPARIRQKVGEEAVEVILAPDNRRLVAETADLFYHLLVLLENSNIDLPQIWQELQRRYDGQPSV